MGRPTNGQEIDFSAHGPKWVNPFGPAHGFCPGLLSMRLVSPFLASSLFSGVVAEASMMSVSCILNIEY
jgi:hypothetical protein